MIINKSGNKKLEQKVRRACLYGMKYEPAMGYFLARIPIVIKKHKIPTLSTNGRWITVPDNEKVHEMFERMDNYKMFQHEAAHIIFEHVKRKKRMVETKDKNVQRKLQAALVAEEYLVNENVEFYDESLIHHQSLSSQKLKKKLKSRDDLLKMTYEELAEYLLKVLPDKKGKMFASGSGNPFGDNYDQHTSNDDDGDIEDILDKEVKDGGYKDQKDLIKGMVKEAATKAKSSNGMGKGNSGFWNQVYDDLFKTRVDWKNVLQKYMKNFRAIQDETGQKQLHRRYHIISRQVDTMPFWSYRKPVIDGVWIAIDTSGSVSDDEYVRMISDALAIVKDQHVTGKIVLFSDGIEKTFDINEGFDKLKEGLKDRTYGGTDLVEVYEKAEEDKANLLIVFSDLYARFPEQTRWRFPTLFLTEDDGNADEAKQYGDIIELDREVMRNGG